MSAADAATNIVVVSATDKFGVCPRLEGQEERGAQQCVRVSFDGDIRMIPLPPTFPAAI